VLAVGVDVLNRRRAASGDPHLEVVHPHQRTASRDRLPCRSIASGLGSAAGQCSV
jgi:hypothetical protein